ncbi:MAG: DNA mismatch repair enzyme (predicted ATPase) [Candidatus Accumulibacter regalis]|uniref:DNA mismatch repair enzyme (Predicted ATPase) n=1 Tax=Accumulibacter regalis TaxID=522306 RepID=A0A011NQ50_ACCRE|nr:ATP-binding protein [Accumulibacter sp.]EXI84883.1 MAG: DNA mismatch repair enzyme (predicted ATPase) [Candidatus Accumulibacter regalis]HRE72838.1 ATP-binding protein [Accumulibacter sp.]
MNGRPAFFETLRDKAVQRWDQLERDPELAGPWHQLFKQVQSPRHVLSELLQNADDAGATEASVDITDGCFLFSHNGEDFTEEHFASLCRFGYSNKRALHTIGFRGIGFKSTFSLGDTVELDTPSLSIAFDRRRFTEPRWIERRQSVSERTLIRVPIRDELRQREIEKNLQEWLASPVSLLFFKHIRRMRIGSRDVHWRSLGPGPVPATERMALHDSPDAAFLVARSEAEAFPEEALAEIRQERLLSDNQEAGFPPCKIEIVLGAKGRLYVVLPTGVETSLPFACNAPFIQDPARLKIKDPETSPTNRWLLERVGKLAASVMLRWLDCPEASVAERSNAYGLFPDVNRSDNSLEGVCAATIEGSFEKALGEVPFLITSSGELKPSAGCIILPQPLLDIWPADQAARLFDDAGRPPLSSCVTEADQQKLIHWGVVEKIDKPHVLQVLQSTHLPKPETWGHLLKLWAYVAPELTGYRADVDRQRVRIVPAQGKDVLYAACEVIRLGEKRLLQSEEDWEFLAVHLLVLNPNWPRFLAEQRRHAEELNDRSLKGKVAAALAVLRAIEMEGASDVSEVIEQVAGEFFSQQGISIAKCVQLTQIAAKLGATVGDAFRFATRDRHLRKVSSVVLFDRDGTLEAFFEQAWCNAHFLHTDYKTNYASCTHEEWLAWVTSGRAGLLGFAPLVGTKNDIYGRAKIEAELRRRGVSGAPSYSYVTNHFRVEDWDFEEIHWRWWSALAKEDPGIWGRIFDRILGQPEASWVHAKGTRVSQVATTRKTRSISNESLLAEWILRLRELPCLRDTRGFYRKPAELLRRTPETESLMDVEPFIHSLLDNEATRPLLKLLGVREVPTGPDRLLDCLRTLAMSDHPPVHEVEKWYRRLDQLTDACSTTDLADIKAAFRDEKIVLSEGAGWTNAAGVFLSSDEEAMPGTAVVRAGVRDLMLWRKIGIADRPTADLAIQWLLGLPSGEVLSQDDARRVRALLPRHPRRIWSECQHWLNLSGAWMSVDTLSYSLSMQSLVAWKHLNEDIKQRTADLQPLSAEVSAALPFCGLPHLAGRIEERLHSTVRISAGAERWPWLNQLGVELRRIELEDTSEQDRIRKLAADLADTIWQTAPGLEIIPYIDGTPAGMPRRAEAVWLSGVLYVEDRPLSKLARAVAQELGRAFRRQDLADAIKLCFDRPPAFVTEYLEENFKLGPQEVTAVPIAAGQSVRSEPSTQNSDDGPDSPAANRPADDEADQDDGEGTVIHLEEPDNGAESDTEGADIPQDPESSHAPLHRPPLIPKPAKLSIIERFARTKGYQRDGTERFFHADGSWISKAHDARFPWERRTAGGDLVCYYWPKEHCLELQALQIEADIWGLLDHSPDNYSLVLSDAQGEPVEVSGTRLRAMLDGREIKLYPASYRLVIDHDHKQ